MRARALWSGCLRHDGRRGRQRPCLRSAGRKSRRADPRALGSPANRGWRSISSWPGAPGRSRRRFWLATIGSISKPAAVNWWSGRRRELAGLIEIRGLGIRRCDFVGEAIVGLVVDLSAPDAERLPPPEALLTRVHGVEIPRIPVGTGYPALPLVVAALTTTDGFSFRTAFRGLFEGNW